MYDCYVIVGEDFKNVIENDEVVGFQIGLRIPFYSSVWLSMVGDTELTVDGETFDADQMTVTLRGKTYPKTNLEEESYEKWEFGEVGILKVSKTGGLQPGEHTVDVRQQVLIGFVEGGLYGHDTKVLPLPG